MDSASDGRVRVFRSEERIWQPLGIPLNATEAGMGFGHAVAVSGDGRTIAVLSRPNLPEGPPSRLQYFDGDEAAWEQVGGNIYEGGRFSTLMT